MKHNWSLVLVILFLLGAGAGERFSAFYVRNLVEKDKDLARTAEKMRARTAGASAEIRKYQEIKHLSDLIQDQVRWEPDSTRVMRTFGDVAARLGVKLIESRTIGMSGESGRVAGGAYQRMRVEARLAGSFWGLLQYVDAIERSAQPMVVESLALTADRDRAGTGDMRMTVSALYPAPAVAGSSATTGEAR